MTRPRKAVAVMAPPKVTFPPTITGVSWDAVYSAAWKAVQDAHGIGHASDVNGTIYPKLTNGEAVTLIMAWMEVGGITDSTFALWYQFAAVAYGWSPATDKLDTSTRQRDRFYPGDVAVELWLQTAGLADTLDHMSPGNPSLPMDGAFTDPTFAGQVAAALRQDGASAQWQIPLPACKDPKTGKPTGKPHKDKNGKWTCDPVVIDDPVTRAKRGVNGLLAMLLVVGAIVWASNNSRRKRRGD